MTTPTTTLDTPPLVHGERLTRAEFHRRSEAFPGLWLDPAALLAGDLPRALAVLQQGIATPEHASFVASLRQSGSTPPPSPA